MAPKYRELSGSEDSSSTSDVAEKDILLAEYYSTRHNDTRSRYVIWALVIVLAVSLSFNILALAWQRRLGDLDDQCSRYTSQNLSPITRDVKISYETRRFTASFLKRSNYTEDPSPEVDAAWLALGTKARHFRIPEDQAHRWGIDPGYAKYDPALGGGYPVLFEFSHHLHCVNLLRQSLYWNYEHYLAQGEGAFTNTPDVIRQHVYHCVDTLRQVLMCQPDTGVFGQYWIRSIDSTFVDFQREHKCKNFGELRDWVVENQISEEFSTRAKVKQRVGDVVKERVP